MLTDEQRAALASRLRRGRAEQPAGIAPRPAGAPVPASYGQQQLWLVDQLQPGLPTYTIAGLLHLRGDLDVAAFGQAVDALVERHEALRTRLVANSNGMVRQQVDPPGPVAMPRCVVPAADIRERLATLVARPFDLARGPLFRIELLDHGRNEHTAIVAVHHCVFDGWSFPLLVRDLAALYAAVITGQRPALPEITVHYGDYARWEQASLTGPAYEQALDYWRAALAGAATLRLPTDHPYPRLPTQRGATERIELDPALASVLAELAARHHTTPFTVLLAAWQVLLARYTGQRDIVVGTPTANRGRAELSDMIGYLVNMLPIRARIEPNATFDAVLETVRVASVAAFARQHVPFAKLVAELAPERDPSRAPIFQVTFAHTELVEETQRAGGVEFSTSDGGIETGTAKFDIAIFSGCSADKFHLLAQYRRDLFEPATIRALLDAFATLVCAALADPTRSVEDLPLLSEPAAARELSASAGPDRAIPTGSLPEHIAQVVARRPDAIAVIDEQGQLSYAELWSAAGKIARVLQQEGVRAGDPVAVCLPASGVRIAAVLGVLIAAGVYVPIDPELPVARIDYLLRDSAARAALVEDGRTELPPGVQRIALDRTALDRDALDRDALDRDAGPPDPRAGDTRDPAGELREEGFHPPAADDLAYLIYTSGSTGEPKGVAVHHGSLLAMLSAWTERVGLRADDRVLQIAALSFDASIRDIFGTLGRGATLVVTDRETITAPQRLAGVLRRREISFAAMSPAMLGLLAGESFPRLRLISCGGDRMPAQLARQWLRPQLQLINSYGPTETTITATTASISGADDEPPIGRPLANYQCYVLDSQGRPLPAGAVGELHIGGVGVARGYHGRAELTAQRFRPDPFSGQPNARLYRTGDLVRRRFDGQLVFLGRIDRQVQLAGVRVEPGEIEAALRALPAVLDAAVVAVPAARGELDGARLLGYVRRVPQRAAPTAQALRGELRDWLPASLLPAQLVIIDEFPLTAGGKIDYAALPAPPSPRPAAQRTAPLTGTEHALAAVLAELFDTPGVDREEDFFARGGNSLLAMRLIARLRHDLGVDLTMTDVYLAPRLRELAAHIDTALAERGPQQRPVIQLSGGPAGTPTLILLHAVAGTVHEYLPLAAELRDTVPTAAIAYDRTAASASWAALVRRYANDIRASDPEGPYLLGGWSLGGLLSYCVADRLERDGARVAGLVLLDAPYELAATPQDAAQATLAFVRDAARTMGRQPASRPDPLAADPLAADPLASDPMAADLLAADPLGWLTEQLAGGRADPEVRAALEQRSEDFAELRKLAAQCHPAPGLHAAVLAIAAEDSPNRRAMPAWQNLLGRGDDLGQLLAGDHYTLLRAPQVSAVATAVRAFCREIIPAVVGAS